MDKKHCYFVKIWITKMDNYKWQKTRPHLIVFDVNE